MRASDLLGAAVMTGDGRRLGIVTGLSCSADGPRHGAVPAPRLRGLMVSPRGAGSALGYQQEGQRGPWLVRVIVRRLHRDSRLVAWSEVASVTDGIVHLR